MQKKITSGLIALILITVTFSSISCIPHIRGNGKVVKQERNISGFEEVSVSTGIGAVINQDSFEKVVVEADENILKILKTEVHGGKLEIFLEEGVLHAKQMKVYVTVKQLRMVEAGSGADVKSLGKISAEKLKLSSSSGSGVKMEVDCNQLNAESSSGSDMTISGIAKSLKASSSSGSGLDASMLTAENGNLSASSGAHLEAQVTGEVKADASSGAGIKILGNPATRDTNSSSGGSVRFK